MSNVINQTEIVEWTENFIENEIIGKEFYFETFSRIYDFELKEFKARVVNQSLSTDGKSSHLTIIIENEKLEREISLINIKQLRIN